ncbi:TetR/AcrR family transcriptional regulator [Solihabitans fulvus]|uniref:TetR/AcrR family transcriptional regulator n=1 Tax=Solihabitans fulvus TaxID=1892852 RepID=A0A5B2WL43_9PSEU|nr:TetR/AcrR family transcriptional regulator C-terminal domain-containing protein [Solihabitans fulvus]KAA2251189.1 TetR/AcrR family transcriptional regulator [Solihabitans fulvus]
MPRDTLTRERIIQTAIELLDADGLEGLNMRSLGKRLDSAATAVYWHVKSKDNLLVLAADQLWHEIALPDLGTVDWRTAATSMATELYAMFDRHPWLVQAFSAHLFYGPGKARHDDHNLAVYEAAGFVGAEADLATAAVFTFVLGNAAGAAATASLTRRLNQDGGNAEERFRDTMAKARDIAMDFPRLRARLENPAAADYAAGPDSGFEYGLRTILDGLQDQLADKPR